jgi:hypothetical protein
LFPEDKVFLAIFGKKSWLSGYIKNIFPNAAYL